MHFRKCSFCILSHTLQLVSPLFANDNPEKVFTTIYDQEIWGNKKSSGSLSGTGSEVINAAPYMEFLQNFVVANDVKSVVDFGCGDWTFTQHIDWNQAKYVGVDVVKSVIEKNRQRYGTESVSFVHANGLMFDLPPADLLICKDVLQHLSNEDVTLFLKQLPKFKHCLITNDVNETTLTSDNSQIQTGDYRLLDLTRPPFLIEGTKIFHYRSGPVTKQVLYIKNINPQKTT